MKGRFDLMKRIYLLGFIISILILVPGCSNSNDTAINMEDGNGGDDIILEEKITLRNLDAISINGEKITSDIFEDKITLVNVWGTFCPPCIVEMPDLQLIHDLYKGESVQVLGIITDTYEGLDTNIDTALEIIDHTGVEYVNIVPNELLVENYLGNVTSIPVSFLVDENGDIIGDEILGAKDYDFFKNLIENNR